MTEGAGWSEPSSQEGEGEGPGAGAGVVSMEQVAPAQGACGGIGRTAGNMKQRSGFGDTHDAIDAAGVVVEVTAQPLHHLKICTPR